MRYDLPSPPQTLGEHLRAKRRERKLLQREVAAQLAVDEHTIMGWEKDRYPPAKRNRPAIVRFLGFDPFS